MKRYLNAFAMCQSMFCAVPCPWRVWDEEARGHMLLFFPVVGLEIGALWAGLAWLAEHFAFPPMITGLLLAAYPFLITGFIHLDGFMDVVDATSSWRDLPRRREILKDSHVGSFAVAGCVLVLLAGFAVFSSGSGDVRILMFVPVVSRCCGALAVTGLKPIPGSQYEKEPPAKGNAWILAVLLAAAITIAFLLCGWKASALLAELLSFGLALGWGYRSLEGMNGDVSGYALVLGELCAGLAYALF